MGIKGNQQVNLERTIWLFVMLRKDASSMQVVITERLSVFKNHLVFHIIWDYTDADELVRNSCLSD